MGKNLKSAIQEVLIILSARCNIKNSDTSSLLDWAKKGFKARLCLSSHKSKSLELPDIVKKALQKDAFKRKNENALEEDSEDEIVNVLADVSRGNTSLEDICVMCCKRNNSVVIQHPFFFGGVCKNCRRLVTKIMESPKGQMNDICILCGLGGNLVYCCNSSCMSAYCETCLGYMTARETLSEILKDADWKCYLCVPNLDSSCLIKKRELYLAVGPPAKSDEKVPIRVLGLTDTVLSVLEMKNIVVDPSSFVSPKNYRQNFDYSLKEIEDISPDFIYDSYFGSSAVEKKENQEIFYSLFYKFLLRLLATRKSKPYVFFMYMCDADILDPLIEKRVKRFLQVEPTKITLCSKQVFLWLNLPAVKSIQGSKQSFKNRGSKVIEEEILNVFLEPLKDFFMQEE